MTDPQLVPLVLLFEEPLDPQLPDRTYPETAPETTRHTRVIQETTDDE